jgi:hypothetical protein
MLLTLLILIFAFSGEAHKVAPAAARQTKWHKE